VQRGRRYVLRWPPKADRNRAGPGEACGDQKEPIRERDQMAVTIRDAGPGDEPAVVELIQELAVALDYPSTIDEHYVRHYLASPESGVLLAVDGDAPVGLVSYAVVPGLFHAADSGLIEALVVAEGRRGEGIGRQLLRAVVQSLETAGCAEISVSTGADNEAAQRVYFEEGLSEASVLLEKHVEQ
jgi:ribosomal protein S18 acetylase RimI-like enzyme